jgi:cell fate (sporulation/competence/biofilm development) regulator YlbF (YheA/YmcA/DUF963 family)
METKQKILEGLDGYKRSEKVNGLVNRATNHLFDAYRELEMAISHCDDPNLRGKLEDIKERLGRDSQVAGYMENENSTIISELQDMISEIKLD